MSRRGTGGALASALMAVAGLATAGSAVAAAPAAKPISVPAKPHPVSIRVTPDSGHSVSRAVSPNAAATIAARGSDGTVYTLSIPSQGLVEPTTVTLTPLRVAGARLGGRVLSGIR